MTKTPAAPPDQVQRERALDPSRSILVQAPAGSGKTDLLTRRFLRLLALVDDPGEIVAITFTIAAAAEMRHRILSELEKAASGEAAASEGDEFSMSTLARRALDRSNALGWKLLDLPSQLRISTIDSFCRDLALQQPILSGLGGSLDIAGHPDALYRRAARQTLEEIDRGEPKLRAALETLLDWRDNNWQELEDQLVAMLKNRDRWMQDFVIDPEPDWEGLRQRLERPFANAARSALDEVSALLDQALGAREEALELARFACGQPGGEQHRDLAELAEFPSAPFLTFDALEEARQAVHCLANLVLTLGSSFRKAVDKNLGFPADRKPEKARILGLIASLASVPHLETALASVRTLPPFCYTEEDWQIVRACFTLLRHAAPQLRVAFAESAAVDFIEVAQIANAVLKAEDGFPSDAALAVADGIRHLLVDEFQDTSRRQHQLLSGLIAAWPDRAGRTLFAVGDPMQSIYFFREADAELFARVKEIGLEIPNAEPLTLDFVPLSANFRTTPNLVRRLNEIFAQVFAEDDGSGVTFSPAEPAREDPANSSPNFALHLGFIPQVSRKSPTNAQDSISAEGPQTEQVKQIIALLQRHQPDLEMCRLDRLRGGDEKYRIAVLARARRSLVPIAEALREAGIPFRAVELEKLAARPEVLDALALARALLNPCDRVAWLGVLRAPWCGLTLDDLHLLTSADSGELLARPIPDLLVERKPLLSEEGRKAVERLLENLLANPQLRPAQPTPSPGTWLRQAWLCLGGDRCVDAAARVNLDLLWSCLDGLPSGEQDLLSPALNEALDKLTALPDPGADSNCGVQLMTIHKSKGLEFEVVVVPDLQAGVGSGKPKMLSWLERGLAKPDDSGEITEFLVAPLPSKGEDSGKSKAWVDRVYRRRETQEDRRILYVAATRAREELHLFARPTYKVEANGEFALQNPSSGLLSTAWPALEMDIREQFEEWKTTHRDAGTNRNQPGEEAGILSLAASAEGNLLVMPSAGKPTLLRRLAPDYRPFPGAPSFSQTFADRVGDLDPQPAIFPSEMNPSRLNQRHEGGRHSRALGTAVHALLEELAHRRATGDWQAARLALERLALRTVAQIRGVGIPQEEAAEIAADALRCALDASRDPIAQWILAPHPDAASEVSWAGVLDGAMTNVRADRVFRAGLVPQSDGEGVWWIVDYKTAHADPLDPTVALPQLRRLFAPQLETYARLLRNLHGEDAVIRAGLYYPRMLLFDWWEF